MELHDLAAVDHADQKRLGSVGVHALGRQHGDAVMQVLKQPGRELVGVLRDHLEFQGDLEALQDAVTDAGA